MFFQFISIIQLQHRFNKKTAYLLILNGMLWHGPLFSRTAVKHGTFIVVSGKLSAVASSQRRGLDTQFSLPYSCSRRDSCSRVKAVRCRLLWSSRVLCESCCSLPVELCTTVVPATGFCLPCATEMRHLDTDGQSDTLQ